MPGSVERGKSNIKEWIEKQPDIKTIVDVGAGSATYPKLLGDGYRYKAIEIWAPYIEQWNLEEYYDEIIVGDIRHVRFPEGDCIIFGDVLEHIEKNDALEVLKRAEEFYRHVIISIPVSEKGKITESEIHYGNWFEKHISAWTYKELNKMYNWSMHINPRGMGIFAK